MNQPQSFISKNAKKSEEFLYQNHREAIKKIDNNEVKELLEITTEDIINLLYKMEESIIINGFIPIDIGEKLKEVRFLNSLYKEVLDIPNIHEIDFPEDFIEEYITLLKKVTLAKDKVIFRIGKLKSIEETSPLLIVLEKNLQMLKMLSFHYLISLELAEKHKCYAAFSNQLK